MTDLILSGLLKTDIIFYGMLVSVVCHVGLSYLSSIKHGNKEMVETGVQTDTLIDYSNKSTQTITETSSVIPTTSEVGTQTIENTSSVIKTTSEVGTQTIVKDLKDLDFNLDIVGRVIDPSNAEYFAKKVDELNALDPFGASP
jgi:hypothetical protein